MSRPLIVSDPSLLPPLGKDGRDGQSIIGPPGRKGDPGLEWAGMYSRRVTYQPGQVVGFEGGSYVCMRESVGYEPTNGRYFSPLALKGAKGKDGETWIYRAGSRRAAEASIKADELEKRVEALEGGQTGEQPTILFAQSTAKGQPVYVGGDGKAYLAKADNAVSSRVAGLAAADVGVNEVGPLNVDSITDQPNWSSVLETGSVLVPGGQLYLSATTAGRLTFVPPDGDGFLVVRVANALSTTAAEVEIAQSVLL